MEGATYVLPGQTAALVTCSGGTCSVRKDPQAQNSRRTYAKQNHVTREGGGGVGSTHAALMRRRNRMTPAPSEPQKTTNSQHTSIPESHFDPAHERAQLQPQRGERAQTKRNETVQHAEGKHVSILAPLSAPKSNRREESVPKSNETKPNGKGTHVLLPRAPARPPRHECETRPRTNLAISAGARHSARVCRLCEPYPDPLE
ncbi:hypothetical protein T484DRAFT_3558895 [Baffinella frigidus]|nr:hypothetical protein T484DRAFT_3558895 [Cryptophyta sp. CCMP2293]